MMKHKGSGVYESTSKNKKFDISTRMICKYKKITSALRNNLMPNCGWASHFRMLWLLFKTYSADVWILNTLHLFINSIMCSFMHWTNIYKCPLCSGHSLPSVFICPVFCFWSTWLHITSLLMAAYSLFHISPSMKVLCRMVCG